MIGGGYPLLPDILGQINPLPFNIAELQLTFAQNVSAVISNEESSIITIS